MTSITDPTLKELVTGGRFARFHHFKDGYLFYNVDTFDFLFPIPIEDTDDGEFTAMMKAVTLMRWIRKHLDEIDKGKL